MRKLFLVFFALVLFSFNVFAGLWESVEGLPQGMADALIESVKQLTIAFIQPLLEAVKLFMVYNIDPHNFFDLWLLAVGIISLFYLLMFLLVGLKFLLGSYDEIQRASAKEWLKNAVVLVVAVNASLLLYSLFLSVSQAVALTLWTRELEKLFVLQNVDAVNIIWVVFFALAAFMALATLFLRHLLLIAGVLLLPFGLFFYLIPPVKGYGSFLLNLLGVMVFMQVFDVILLVAVSLLAKEFTSIEITGVMALTFGLFFVAVMNFLLVVFAFHKGASAFAQGHPSIVSAAKSVAGKVLHSGYAW